MHNQKQEINDSITIFPGFSSAQWMNDNGYLSPLSASETAELMAYMRVGRYLINPTCDASTGIYSGTTDGWNNSKGLNEIT